MRTIIVAPHPDDEVLGAGGTLLRRKSAGEKIAWLIVTSISEKHGWKKDAEERRNEELSKISNMIGFDEIFKLNFAPACLDQVPMGDLVLAISRVFEKYQPNEIFMPHVSDVHTDHQIVSRATISCAKWFRVPSIQRILAYETVSETDLNIADKNTFRPNVFVNIERFLDKKIEAMNVYKSEVGEFPFPRSADAVRALAKIRGSSAGFMAAEAFELLKERVQ